MAQIPDEPTPDPQQPLVPPDEEGAHTRAEEGSAPQPPQPSSPDVEELKDLLNTLWNDYPAVRDNGKLRDLRASWEEGK